MLDTARLRILVVDDQESMRSLLCAGLRALNYTSVACAADGISALEQLKIRAADLVLLDVEMPRMNGLDTLRAIRSDPGLRALPVIMVTGRADAGFIQQLAGLGVDGYLVKPVTAAALGARIEAVLQKKARSALAAQP